MLTVVWFANTFENFAEGLHHYSCTMHVMQTLTWQSCSLCFLLMRACGQQAGSKSQMPRRTVASYLAPRLAAKSSASGCNPVKLLGSLLLLYPLGQALLLDYMLASGF